MVNNGTVTGFTLQGTAGFARSVSDVSRAGLTDGLRYTLSIIAYQESKAFGVSLLAYHHHGK